jgi:hypothetical protein
MKKFLIATAALTLTYGSAFAQGSTGPAAQQRQACRAERRRREPARSTNLHLAQLHPAPPDLPERTAQCKRPAPPRQVRMEAIPF